MVAARNPYAAVSLMLTHAISQIARVDEIYSIALDALTAGLGVERSSILLFDSDGVMRFKASRGLSEGYRRAVEGHTPWTPDSRNPQPIVVADVTQDPSLESYRPNLEAEGISAVVFVPLVSLGRVIGKFMLYYRVPHTISQEELQLATVIAAQVAFAVEHTRTEELARRSEERLRFALDAASMGTWDWNLTTNAVEWSENLERIHGLAPGTFDGTFSSYEREIHPEDRERVLASVQRAIAEGIPHDVEYRIVAPDGTVRWCLGKGRVEYVAGTPVRMTGVCLMVTRRKEAELARLAAAEEASRLKDEFLATLSHELRTPLNAIVGWVQLLQAGSLPPERARQAIDVIGRNSKLQAQLIEDMLDVSRIVSGKLEIERVPVPVEQLIDTVVTGAAPAALAKNITILQSVADDLPVVLGDPRRLHQVLGNVMSNAIKFTPDGGEIRLESSVEGEWLVIAIGDSGVGISPEFLPYVFDRFRQADSRAARVHDGLGLGLAIARHLVDAHGGTISARSDGRGQGTTVTIGLPIMASAREALSTSRSPRERSEATLDDVTIAVVDDQHDSRELLATLLEQRGATVLRCDSAQSAESALANGPVQLLIADIGMPEIDGYKLVGRLRAAGITVPAIAVTAFARPEDHQRALAAGFTAHCAKPVDRVELLRTVRDALVPAQI